MYSYEDRISYSQVNSKLEPTYFSIVNLMQDCSCFHSDDVGVGLAYLQPLNMGWFVTSYEIHVVKMPEYSQKVKISTYPYQMRGMMAKRIYVIESMTGELLAYANSQWILMNLISGRPERIPEIMLEAYNDGVEPPELEFFGDRLRLAEGSKSVGVFTVTESYIDTNGHMNNSFYIDVTRKYLPEESFKTITINYKKAALLNDTLEVKLEEIEGGYQIALTKENDIYTIVEYK